LKRVKILYTSDTIQTYLQDFYFYDNEYFAIIRNDENNEHEKDTEGTQHIYLSSLQLWSDKIITK
jgi:hypothetical protein